MVQKEKKNSYGEGANEVFFVVEDMPQFPGGDQALREFIAKEVSYPEIAHKNGIQGKVYVTFVVEKAGLFKILIRFEECLMAYLK